MVIGNVIIVVPKLANVNPLLDESNGSNIEKLTEFSLPEVRGVKKLIVIVVEVKTHDKIRFPFNVQVGV